jgi:hypothetical protein
VQGRESLQHTVRAIKLTGGRHARVILEIQPTLADEIDGRIALNKAGKAFREGIRGGGLSGNRLSGLRLQALH